MVRGKFKRGSVLLMVIGLLMIIAMLGSMLLLVSRLDRQTSQAIATVAPEQHVAEGILDRLVANRLGDLYIDANVLYGKMDLNDPNISERQMMDYPADPSGVNLFGVDPNQWFDNALATIEPNVPNGTWRHVSHLTGTALFRDANDPNANDPNNPNDPNSALNAPFNDANAVDTDGDGNSDAYLFNTGIQDREGGSFFAAVRMIDAAGLLNVNVAGDSQLGAMVGRVMEPNDMGLDRLMGTIASSIFTERTNTGPYDVSDMLALGWQGDPNDPNYKGPNTLSGRLFDAAGGVGGTFSAVRGSLTTVSTDKPVSPLWTYQVTRGWVSEPNEWVIDPNRYGLKADPNKNDPNVSDPNERQKLYGAFLALLNGNDDSNTSLNRTKAAQLTVNFIDYVDPDPNVITRIDASTLDPSFPANTFFYYGVERHPFVSKVFLKRMYDPVGGTEAAPISALELINPYVNPIPLENYQINGTPLSGTIDPNGGRFVIRSDANVQVAEPNAVQNLPINAAGTLQIMWKLPAESWAVCVDETLPVNCTAPVPDPNDPNKLSYWHVRFRDDRLPNAHYSLALYEDSNDPRNLDGASDQDLNCDYTNPSGPKMGQPNLLNDPSGAPAEGVPVYVRNGPMISLGDMMRVMIFGPSETEPLTARITGQSPTSLWLVPKATNVPPPANITQPALPAGCVVSEFFNLLTPDPNKYNSISGLININTASQKVLECLPGMDANAAQEVIAYRDRLNNSINGGKNYSAGRAAPSATGITGLREGLGFACASEVAIPLSFFPATTYNPSNLPPENYAVSENPTSDDGFATDPSACPQGDFVKQYARYSWLANQVAVRSNTFIAYIRVQRGHDPKSPQYRSYVAVIDRSNCKSVVDRPRVLLFAELK